MEMSSDDMYHMRLAEDCNRDRAARFCPLCGVHVRSSMLKHEGTAMHKHKAARAKRPAHMQPLPMQTPLIVYRLLDGVSWRLLTDSVKDALGNVLDLAIASAAGDDGRVFPVGDVSFYDALDVLHHANGGYDFQLQFRGDDEDDGIATCLVRRVGGELDVTAANPRCTCSDCHSSQ